MAPAKPIQSLTQHLFHGVTPVATIALILLISLILMSQATQGSEQFDKLYLVLIGINILGLLALFVRLVFSLCLLIKQIKGHFPGALLTGRMVLRFVLLAVTPVVVVYWFSVQFLQHGIDSWFDVRVDQAMSDSLELSSTSFEERMRESMKTTEAIATELVDMNNEQAVRELDTLRNRIKAHELALFKSGGAILGSSSEDPVAIVPSQPDETIIAQLRQGENYIALDPLYRYGLNIRVVVNVPNHVITAEPRILQALFPVSERMNELVTNVQAAFTRYSKLVYLRDELKLSFILTLSLVLLFSVFTAVWAAFYVATRMVAPLTNLVRATHAVAAGDYAQHLKVPLGKHEISFLVSSFNDMTERLQTARNHMYVSQQLAEQQRAYLETVLMRLSTGVITIGTDNRIIAVSNAASRILGIPLTSLLNHQLSDLMARDARLNPFVERLHLGLAENKANPSSSVWRDQIIMHDGAASQVLMISVSLLPGSAGQVIVFDDISALIQAQRNAAWSEVARRLAHEIKNPLTPIQLSTERIRLKFLNRLQGDEYSTFDRLTRVIVQQVESMKNMVNAFAHYAYMPAMQAQALDITTLVRDVVELYVISNQKLIIALTIEESLPTLYGDPDRLCQLMHNLLKNAIEATEAVVDAKIWVTLWKASVTTQPEVVLTVSDNGQGFPTETIGSLFEPYFTSKTKGTGLGLAIVKKIAEEHNGIIQTSNAKNGGAVISVRFSARNKDDII